MIKILSNFIQIELNKSKFNAFKFITHPQVKFKELRESYPGFSFAKYKNNVVYWRKPYKVENITPPKGIPQEISFKEAPYIHIKIIEEGIIAFLIDQNFKLRFGRKGEPHEFTDERTDLSNGLINGLQLFPKYQITFRQLHIGNEEKNGICVSCGLDHQITWSLSDFESKEFNKQEVHQNEKGLIVSSSSNIWKVVGANFKDRQYKMLVDKHYQREKQFSWYKFFVKNILNPNKDKIVFPDNLKVHKLHFFSQPLSSREGALPNFTLSTPIHYYYRGKHHDGKRVRHEVRYNKPYSYEEFENKTILVSAIFPTNFNKNGEVNSFLNSLKIELENVYKIKSVNIREHAIPNDKLASYQLEISKKEINSSDLVVIVTSQDQKDQFDDSPNISPYHYCKAKLLERSIPSQEILIENIREIVEVESIEFNWSLHSLGLNSYAKLGGTAWTVEPNDNNNELVIGIGATTDKNGKPVLAISQIFKANGVYLLGLCDSVTDMESYEKTLELFLFEKINWIINNKLIDSTQKFRLIFHIYKPAGKENELKAIKNLEKRLKDYDFESTYLHIGFGHNYRFHCLEEVENEQGATLSESSAFQEGQLIILNHNRAFLNLNDQNPTVVKVDLHKDSKIKDLKYLGQQLYNFSALSHRTYKKGHKPITIKYPQLMARIVEQLNGVKGFQKFDTLQPSMQSLWFL